MEVLGSLGHALDPYPLLTLLLPNHQVCGFPLPHSDAMTVTMTQAESGRANQSWIYAFKIVSQITFFSLHKDHMLHDRTLTSTEIRTKAEREVDLVFNPSGFSRGPIIALVPSKNPD